MNFIVLVALFLASDLNHSHALPLPETVYPALIQRHGLNRATQSFCYEDESGIITGERVDQKVIPASVTKAYTTYVALKKYGPNFRFQTRFDLLSDSSGTRLHISGDHDGYFLNDQLFYVLNALNDAGTSELLELSFDSNFYLNFNLDPSLVKADLVRVFKTASWTEELKAAYALFVKRAQTLGLKVHSQIPKMDVKSAKIGSRFKEEPTRSMTVPSLPLIQLLKDMNVHSTNRFAKSVFVRIHDAAEFNRILHQDLSTDEMSMRFSDGSGGQSNYTTCRVTLRLFKALETLLSGYALKLNDVISVGGMDGGTLRNRFNQDHNSESVMGKTGTLPDIGVSTLAGKISSLMGGVYFGIFNRYPVPDISKAKELQNELVDEILKAHSGKKSLDHQPWSFEVLGGIKFI